MKYVALLRGIGPGDSRMSHESFRNFFSSLGFINPEPLLSSGNIVFEAQGDPKELEERIEKALPEKLGFARSTVVRSEEQLKRLVEQKPFDGFEDSHSSTLNVTFLKNPQKIDLVFPYQIENKNYQLVGEFEGAVFSVIDVTQARTVDLMNWLEKQFGKEITTRTWKTVNRILKKME